MKKIYTLTSLFIMMAVTLGFTSCDDDEYIAYTLEGTWRGNMYMQHEYSGATYDATYSVIEFERNPFRDAQGTGYWVDYYNTSGWGRNYVANHIRWKVRDEIIYIHFNEENTDLEISNYRLKDSRFRGYIYDGNTRVAFDLYHVDSPNWNDYYYDDYYYAPAKSGQAVKNAKNSVEKKIPVRKIRQE